MAETNNVIELPELLKAFDPNEGAPEKDGAKLPSTASFGEGYGKGLGVYAELAERVLDGTAPQGTFLERVITDFQKAVFTGWEKVSKSIAAKAIDVPGNFLTFARMSYMPDSTSSNILPWPGVHPEAIRKIIMENVAPNLIIGTRVDDVLSYSQPSEQLWRPGWRLGVMQGDKSPSTQDKKDIHEAQEFLMNSATRLSYVQTLERDEQNLTDFQHFLAAETRDTLSFDGMAISTDRDLQGRVVRYAPVPAGNIRLVGIEGYEGDQDIFAVAVDEGGAVKRRYTRKELIWYVRNARTDPEYAITMTRSYGTPEITTALKLVQIFQNVIDFNSDVFNRSGVPHGLLLLTGNGWTQKQVDVLTRMWHNLKRGITKALALPVLAAPKDGKVEIVDFSRIKGDEALYQDLLNLSIGCFCAVFRFPVHRLGYRISGHGRDSNSPMHGNQTSGQMVQEEDRGLAVILIHLENVINQHFVWPRWPNLRFSFTGKSPKEDAREYEGRKNAMTWAEVRAEADLPKLETMAPKGPEGKKLAEIMAMAPIDPNLSGIFQSVVSAMFKPDGEEGQPGNTMSSSKDPAESEKHGKPAGVRRDSAAESGSAVAH